MRGRDIKTGRFADNGVIDGDPLREKLEKLAVRFAEQMLGETDREDSDRRPLGEEDAAMFKTLTMYYTQTRRLPISKPDDDEDTGFGSLKDRIMGAEDAGSRE